MNWYKKSQRNIDLSRISIEIDVVRDDNFTSPFGIYYGPEISFRLFYLNDENKKQPIGSVNAAAEENPERKKLWYFSSLQIDPNFRSFALVRKLKEIIANYLKKYGINRFELDVLPDNRAKKLYERWGFQPGVPSYYDKEIGMSLEADTKYMNIYKEASLAGFLKGFLPLGIISALLGLGLNSYDLQNKPVQQVKQEIVQEAEEQGYSPEAISVIERSIDDIQKNISQKENEKKQDNGVYIIQPGDTLTGIAKNKLGSPLLWKKIVELNPGINPNKLKPGQQIKMPLVIKDVQTTTQPTTRPTTKSTTQPTTQPATQPAKKEEQKISDPKLAELKSEFKSKVEAVLKDLSAKGWKPKIAEGLRTIEQQKDKVQKGYSKTMNSAHLKGYGADIIDSRYGWSGPAAKTDYKFWKDLGAAAKKQGLIWGGDWKFIDVGHVEYPGWQNKK